MSKIDIERLIYKKPNLNLGVSSLYRIHKESSLDDVEPDPEESEKPGTNSTGTGGEFVNP